MEGVGKAGGGELGLALGGIPRLLRALPTTHVQPCMGSALEMAGLSTQAGESWQMGKGTVPSQYQVGVEVWWELDAEAQGR